MNLQDFRALEIKLGYPPTQAEVKAYKAKKSMFKTVHIKFTDSKYNYITSVNSRQTDKQIINYFKGQLFNLSNVHDDLHVCIKCTVKASDFKTFLN